MKLLKIGLSLLTAVSLVACGDDDSSPSFDLTAEAIVGTYVMTSCEYEKETVGEVGGQSFTVSASEEVFSFQDTELVLMADGTFTSSGFTTSEVIENGDLVNDNKVVDIADEGTYDLSIENESITFTSTSGDAPIFDGMYELESISASRMTIVNSTVEMSGTDTITSETTYSFTR